MDLLNLLPGGSLTAILATVGTAILAIWRAYASGKKAGRDAEKVKGAEADAKRIEKVGQAVDARNDVLSGRLQSDPNDPNRRD